MTHARLCLWLPICLLACARGPSPSSSSTSPTDSSTADANAQASGETVAIVAVPQRVPTTRTWEWRFDPNGRFMAEEFDDPDLDVSGCGIWDIESGSFVRAYVDSDHEDGDGLSPCDTWELGSTLSSDSSADGTLRASVSGGLQIINSNGASQKIQDCASCGDAMAWAPSGYQLATCNGQALEIWDASTGKRLRTETLAIPDVTEVQLGWTEEGIGAIVRHEITGLCHEIEPDESYCDWELADYDEDGDPLPPEPIEGVALSTFWWPADGGPAIERREVYTASNIDQYQVDVGVRWLVLSKEMGFDRDGSSTAVYAFGVGPRTSGLGFTEYYTADEPWIETWEHPVDRGRDRHAWIRGLLRGDAFGLAGDRRRAQSRRLRRLGCQARRRRAVGLSRGVGGLERRGIDLLGVLCRRRLRVRRPARGRLRHARRLAAALGRNRQLWK